MAVESEKKGTVYHVRINRPDAMNAINFDVMAGLEKILDQIENDSDARLFILTGAGKSFISGGDLKEFHSITDADGAREMSKRMLSILDRIEKLQCWTLAAVNGHAYGGGWETMLSCDFRVAKSSAKFGFTQGKFYLPPGWGGLTRLSETVGSDRAKYWLASQQVIDAETALQGGLIQDVFFDQNYDEHLGELIKKLTLNDRAFIEYMKADHQNDITKELEPFSWFWESDEHSNRVEQFLNAKKNRKS